MTDPLSAEQRIRFDAINRDLSRTVTVFLTPADFRALLENLEQAERERDEARKDYTGMFEAGKANIAYFEKEKQLAEATLTALRAENARLRAALKDVTDDMDRAGGEFYRKVQEAKPAKEPT